MDEDKDSLHNNNGDGFYANSQDFEITGNQLTGSSTIDEYGNLKQLHVTPEESEDDGHQDTKPDGPGTERAERCLSRYMEDRDETREFSKSSNESELGEEYVCPNCQNEFREKVEGVVEGDDGTLYCSIECLNGVS